MALLFNGNSPKKIIYNGFNLARVIYNGVVVWLAKILTLITGKPPLTLPNSTGENLVDYKIYGNSKQGGLPDGYTELEYIESTGEQYIDTGFVGNNNTRVLIDFYTGTMTQNTALFGSRDSSNLNALSFWYINSASVATGKLRADYNGSSGSWIYQFANTDIENRYLLDYNKNNVTIGSDSHTFATATFTNPSNILLFCCHLGTTADTRRWIGKIYSCKIYDNNTLIRDFIPCINPENEVGMYDIVNKKFYANVGTGTFVAGLKVDLPEGYQRLEYIESTGTQYIDTGITATNNTGMSIKYRYTADGSAAISGIFKSANPRQDTFFISSQTGSLPGTAFIAHRGNTTSTTLGDVLLNTDYTAKINYKNDGKIYYDDDYITDVGTRAVWDATIPIFARLNASNQNIAVSNSRIYYVEFTEGSTISHKFVPAKNPSGTIGMYDLVNDIFHTNAGTGDFVAGNAVTLPDGYIRLDYIEADGTQYIDTGISPDINTQVDYKIRFREGALVASPLMGVRLGSSNNNRYFPIAYNALNTECRSALGTKTPFVETINFNIDYEGSFQPQNEVTIVNGVSYSLEGHNFRKDSNYNMYLFATLGYVDNLYQSSGIIYYCKVYQSGTLVRDFVPCITPDNQIGLYDLVSKQFFSNQGTGSFIAGTASEMQFVGDKTKNLYDISTSVLGGLRGTDGAELESTTRVRTDYIEINNTYSIRIDANDNYSIVNIYYYDENKNYTGYSNLNTSGKLREYTGTVTSGTKYIRPVFCVYDSTSTNIDLATFKQSKIQIEKGSTITDYVPYGYVIPVNVDDTITNIYLPDPLRKTGSANVVKLPSGYTQLEYIESTGTQYIDTNYAPNAQTKIQAVVAFTEDTGSMQNYGAIANLGTSSRVNYARWHFGVFSNKLCVFRENTTQSGDIKLDYDNDFHTYEITNTSCSLDDTTKDIALYTNSNITFTLFARNGYTTAGGTASISAYSNSKLKSFKIYENDALIRDFIPCKNSSNVVGLYDIVNNEFYTNQGTGTFIAGSPVYADYLDYENQIVKWIVGLPSPVEEAITLPDILTNEGDNVINVETFIKPSNMVVQYYKKAS